MTIGQFGQYNFPRCARRKAVFPTRYAETKFCADVISLVFLLNRKYTPFFKWMHRALLDLPVLGRWVYSKIQQLIHFDNDDDKVEMIEEICRMLIAELNNQGLSGSKSAFLLDHGPAVQQKIADSELRQRNVWVG
jgi:hypothetical protein